MYALTDNLIDGEVTDKQYWRYAIIANRLLNFNYSVVKISLVNKGIGSTSLKANI